jgi:uncharacterized small protein (DUF1192 family)
LRIIGGGEHHSTSGKANGNYMTNENLEQRVAELEARLATAEAKIEELTAKAQWLEAQVE